MDKYLDFCNKCIEGKIGYKKFFYILDKPEPSGISKDIDISVVSPTQAAVEQAKSELNLQNGINRPEKRKYDQIGGKSSSSSSSRSITSRKRSQTKRRKKGEKVIRTKGKKKKPRKRILSEKN